MEAPGTRVSICRRQHKPLNIRANLDQQVLQECANHLLFLSPPFFGANYVYYANLFYCQQPRKTQLLLNNIIIYLALACFQRRFFSYCERNRNKYTSKGGFMHDCAQDVKPWVQELRTAYSSRKNTVAEEAFWVGP